MNRRELVLGAALSAALACPVALRSSRSLAASGDIDIDAILDDPEAPVAGNPDGDVTIVAFMDYNCPFCKRSSPDLESFIRADGKVRLVYKDWPILAKSSVYGAQLALAAKYQGRYQAAHIALMGIRGGNASEASMTRAVRAAGVDMNRLEADLKAHEGGIAALLERNQRQAKALGLEGTPVYLIGPFMVAKALDADEFKEIVADFRARIGK
jgi:protein-disulfide isomerase